MSNKIFLEKLKEKYNYNDKTINALSKIIPNLIEYYGTEYETVVLNAIYDCEIIPCNSYQTISKIEKEKTLSKITKEESLKDMNLKRNESAYLSNIKISYHEMTNTFNIDEIKRTIVTAHTFNYDSPKGLEVLTYALCKLIKSYQNEYKIEENKLIKKSGISLEKMQIIKDKDEIYLVVTEEEGIGLEEGLTIYDTQQIVSMTLKDKYKCYDYDSVYTVAEILKEQFNLLDEINDAEITKENKTFETICKELKIKCDEIFKLEHKMYISMLREEKDEITKKINKKLTNEKFVNTLMQIYEKSKINLIKNQV